jgi:hypothetical protein
MRQLVLLAVAFLPAALSLEAVRGHKLCAMEQGTIAGFIVEERLEKPVDDFNYGGATGRVWYQNNWEPHIPCVEEERVGEHGDGGKWVCDPICMLKRNRCTVLSFGSNNQVRC